MTFLIKKPAKSGDVVTIKLSTAEELIARLDAEDDAFITVSRPMTLSYGAQGVGMTPWLITAENDSGIQISKKRIMVMTPTMKKAAEQYIEGTTGIKVVG
jgi:hypothetical protein